MSTNDINEGGFNYYNATRIYDVIIISLGVAGLIAVASGIIWILEFDNTSISIPMTAVGVGFGLFIVGFALSEKFNRSKLKILNSLYGKGLITTSFYLKETKSVIAMTLGNLNKKIGAQDG